MIIKVKTTQPVNYTTWLDQVSRFATNGERSLVASIPQKTLIESNNGNAEIIIDIKTPLLNGFKANIKYIQNYTTQVQTTNIETQAIETIDNNNQVVIVEYVKEIPLTTLNLVLQEIAPLLPTTDANKTDVERIIAKIPIAVIADIVSHNTFLGLTANDYTYEIL